MQKILALALAGLLSCVSAARADFTAKDGAAATITFKNPGTCTAVVCVPVFQLYDGTNVVTLTTAGADGVSNTLTGQPVYGRMLQFNGTTWDRWQGAIKAASGAFAAGSLAAGAGVDGWDLTQGAIADAAATAGSTGSVSAKLRLMTTQLGTLATNQTGGSQKTQVVDGSGNVQPSGDVAARAIFEKITDGTNTATVKAASTNAASTDTAVVADPRPNSAATVSGSTTNPTSTLALTSATTAYSTGTLIATSATAGSVVNPSFAIANSAGGASINRLRLSVNDATSTAWAGQTVQIDLWATTPTWTNGDRSAWLPATGAAGHLGSFACTFPSPVWGDGSAAECAPNIGNFVGVKLASGTSVFWSLQAVSGSGVTGASKVFTLAAELLN